MRKAHATLVGSVALGCAVALSSAPSAMSRAHGALRPIGPRAVIEHYCLECHDDDKQKGDLTLELFDPSKPEQRPDVGEKMIRKLRAGMMPPPGKDRPTDGSLD